MMKDYGWKNDRVKKQLNSIMEVLEPYCEFYTYYIVIPDNYKDYIDKSLLVGLGKTFYSYTRSGKDQMILKSTFTEKMERERQRKEKEQKAKEQLEQELKNKIKIIEEFKRTWDGEWHDKEWIEKNIGKYYNWDPVYEYYWTLIGDRWKVKDWKHNIQLSVSAIGMLNNMVVAGVKGKKILTTKFQNNAGYSCGIVETGFKDITGESNYYGIYGIYADDELIYIGSTIRSFEERFNEHKVNLMNGSKELKVYDLIRQEKLVGKKIELKIILNCANIKVDRKLTLEDIESMELGFISYFKPRGNMAGIYVPFKYKE